MAGNTNSDVRRRRRARRNAKKRGRVIIFAVEILLILIMLVILYVVMTKGGKGPQVVELDKSQLGINDTVKNNVSNTQQGGTSTAVADPGVIKDTGYMNIALFGVDATTPNGLYKGSRSDSTMIASINMDTGDIKLVSVYRDTYLNLSTDKYDKCCHAYAGGGAEQAIKMLNMNLNMDITNFITVNYQSLIDLIDGLGGIYIDVNKTELSHINNYQATIVKDLNIKNGYTPVTTTGYQKLNGLQATAFCRIRYIEGGDFGRASNQREVIKAIEEQAKKTDVATLTNVFSKVIEEIYTSIDSKDLLELVTNINNYRIVDEGGFPEESMRTTGNIGAKGSCVIPLDLESNVVWLHKFLFNLDSYTVSDTVKECSAKVKSDTSAYVNR
ncbi:MAG: LCP family protein [Lachnospiraceae bacterium]|nr:LCP family protein [Lachnospiraceae bacterium]